MGKNRLLEWLPAAVGWDGASLHMAGRTPKVRGGNSASKEHGVFASRFAQELAKWLAAETGRTKRQFADFCGTDERTIQRWETDGVGKSEIAAGSPMGYASAFLGVRPNSWWAPEILKMEAIKTPSALDADIASALVIHARREAFVNAAFRRDLQDLLERHKNQG